MDVSTTKQIYKINSNNTQRLTSIRTSLSSLKTIISGGEWQESPINVLLNSAAAINKKAEDSAISLNTIFKDREYDNYSTAQFNYLKNAIFVSSTMPATGHSLTPLVFTVQYKNTGLFYSWNSLKGIKLRIRVYRTTGLPQLYSPIVTALNLSLPQNIPGDLTATETNADYERIKIFNVTSGSDYIAGEYTFTFSIINSDISNTDYESHFINSLYSQSIVIS